MAENQKKMSPADGWDGDYDISIGEYREIVEVAGHKIRKPIEVCLMAHATGQSTEDYTASHYLPSNDDNPKGEEIKVRGKTSNEAGDNLVLELVRRYETASGVQKQYLDSIFIE